MTAAGTAVLASLSAALAALYVWGGSRPLAAMGGTVAVLAVTWLFVRFPETMLALTVAVIAATPALKLLAAPELGVLKDALIGAAVVGSFVTARMEPHSKRARLASVRPLHGLAGLLVGLYVVNLSGVHDAAWAFSVRQVVEAVALLVVGASLPSARHALVVVAKVVIVFALLQVAVGLWQQWVGADGLILQYGYTFEEQVRLTADGQLRSFGTFNDPFGYAAFLCFALAAVAMIVRDLRWRVGLAVPLLIGLYESQVRTAAVAVVALLAVVLLRRGRAVVAGAVAIAACGGAIALTLTATPTVGTSTVNLGGTLVTLNGRTSFWGEVVGEPRQWALGRGVGSVGVGADRAQTDLVYTPGEAVERFQRTGTDYRVDSSYLLLVAEVGVVGLVTLLCLIAWSAVRLIQATPTEDVAWLGLGIGAVLVVDGLTRSSLLGFPTGFVGLLMVGLALGACARTLEAPENVRAERRAGAGSVVA